MPTANFQAAVDSSDVILSYAKEANWGVKPAVAFKQIRVMGESLTSSKGRNRPGELSNSGQAAAAVTIKVDAGGDVNIALSDDTFDDFLAAVLRSDWATAVNKAASTIAATGTGFTDSGSGFVTAGIQAGQFLKVAGFTGGSAALINGIYRVDTVAAGVITTTPAPGATKVVGDPVVITGQMLRNGTTFQSFFIQKGLASDKFLHYAGSWPSGLSLDANYGDFVKGVINFLSQSQVKAVADGSTGAQVAAPTGNVIDTVLGISHMRRNGVLIASTVQKLGVKLTSDGARTQNGMGSASAQGIGMGLLTAAGGLETYFKDFSLYDEFVAETTAPLSFCLLDSLGGGYMITFCAATLMNPKIVAGGPGQDVTAAFDVEGNPGPVLFGGRTIQIDKL